MTDELGPGCFPADRKDMPEMTSEAGLLQLNEEAVRLVKNLPELRKVSLQFMLPPLLNEDVDLLLEDRTVEKDDFPLPPIPVDQLPPLTKPRSIDLPFGVRSHGNNGVMRVFLVVPPRSK